MATSSKSKVKCLGPRFYDYLNGLQEEFELHSHPGSPKRMLLRFNIYLEGLKCEFALMTGDIESLRKERDELEIKVGEQAMELSNIRNNVNVGCRRCSKSPARNIASTLLKTSESKSAPSSAVQPKRLHKPNSYLPVKLPASTSRNVTPALLKTSSSTSVFQPKSLPKPNTSSRVVKPSQQTSMTVTRKARPSQCVSSRCPDPIVAYSQNVTAPSPLPQLIVDADAGPEERDCSTTSNDGSGKGLRMDMAHVLSHGKRIWRVKFSQDGKYLAVGCQDGRTYVYDVQTGTSICVLRNLLAEDDLNGAVCFSHDGKYLATGSSQKGIYIWEINTKYVRNAFKEETLSIRSLDFSPDGRLLVSASESNSVWLCSMRDGAAKELTDNNPEFDARYTSAVFSPDGGHVAASHRDGMVRLWRVRTGQLMRRVVAHTHSVFDVGFTPDGKGLVSGGETLKYWDITSWDPTLFRARSQTGYFERCSSASEEQTRPDREYAGHNASVYCLAISPDGRWVASGSWDNTARIWDTRSGAVQCSLDHNDWAYSVDFSPASHYLASGEGDGTVRIWRYYSHMTSGVSRVPS